jgi:hypothetical protein
MKITKRDIIFFVVGLFTMLMIESIYDWEGTKQAAKEGWETGMSRAK